MKILILMVSVFLLPSEAEYTGGKVQVSVYCMSGCPYCHEFFEDYLEPLTKDLGSYMETLISPNGGTKILENGTVTCSHGPEECEHNMVQRCTLAKMSGKPNPEQVLMIGCEMKAAHYFPETTEQECCKKFGVDWDAVSNCTKGTEGRQLLEKAKAKEPAGRRGTPTVEVAGVRLKEWRNIKEAVCAALSQNNIKPDVCSGDLQAKTDKKGKD